MEHLVERELAGETEVLGENCASKTKHMQRDTKFQPQIRKFGM
jgi:hypothetical protein